jgi:diguanylate cyclase (GGDEF)-like protein/PAS domain S-box-containing protein
VRTDRHGSGLQRLRSWLPQGSTLPEESWRARHRAILTLGAVHAVVVPVYGVAQGFGVLHCLLESSAIAMLVAVGWVAGRQGHRRMASSAASVALLTASALIVHLSSGLTEAHFHFFVIIVVLTLYEDWVPFLVALAYVAVHHGIGGLIDPGSIYSNPHARAHPWEWAGIHAGFVAAAGLAGVSTWKHNEQARARALEAEREAEQLYRSVVETLSEGVMLLSPEGEVRAANASAARILGTTVDRMIGANTLEGHRDTLHEDGSPWAREDHPGLATARTGEPQREQIMGLRRRDGVLTWISLSSRPLRREPMGWASVVSLADITERKRAQSELEHLADHDPLTGLLNRRRLEADVTRDLAAVARYDTGGAVLVLDLDNFKYVNDSLGHGVGDQLICRAAEVISEHLRESDTVARLGGDEFAVVLPHADAGAAVRVAQMLLEGVREEAVVSTVDGPRRTTASIGIALMTPGLTTEELMAQADIAMYEAKERGKDRAQVFDPGGDRQAQAKAGLSWAERIRAALRDGRFVLHAQPIVGLAGSGADRRYELLVRMRSETGGMVAPGVFLPVAERFDLIADIDRWVLRRAATLLGDLRARGRTEVMLSVNLSARSIDLEMLDLLRSAFDRTNGDPRRLTVEITETAAIADLERAKAFARGLNAMGSRLALDDFGSGFASFHYLKHLDFDEIKIDGEYVQDMADSDTHRLLVRSLVDIAQGLGKDTTAEFVSDDRTIEMLNDFGVHWGQGFHLGRPAPLEEHGLVLPDPDPSVGGGPRAVARA